MFRLVMLAVLFAAVACSSQEEGSDVGAAGESAAEVAGEAVVSARESAGVALDSASESASDVVQQAARVVQAPDADVAAAPDGEAAAGLGNPLAAVDEVAATENRVKEQAGALGALGQPQP